MKPYVIAVKDENQIFIRNKLQDLGDSADPSKDALARQLVGFLIEILKRGEISFENFNKLGSLLWKFLNIDANPGAIKTILDAVAAGSKTEPFALLIPETAIGFFNFPWEILRYDEKSVTSLQELFYLYRQIDNRTGELLVKSSEIRILLVAAAQTQLNDRNDGGLSLEPIDLAPLVEFFDKKQKENPAEAHNNTKLSFVVNKIENIRGDRFSIEGFKSKLKAFKPHIVHFVSHGDFIDGQLKVAMNADPNSLKIQFEPVSKLLDCFIELKNNPSQNNAPENYSLPSLVFLQVCKLALFPGQGGIDIAASLSNLGIPAVIGMQLSVGYDASTRFATTFYDKILNTNDPDNVLNAFYQSKQKTDEGQQIKFGNSLPVLYLINNGTLLKSFGGMPNAGNQDPGKEERNIDRTRDQSTFETSRATGVPKEEDKLQKDLEQIAEEFKDDLSVLAENMYNVIKLDMNLELSRYQKSKKDISQARVTEPIQQFRNKTSKRCCALVDLIAPDSIQFDLKSKINSFILKNYKDQE